MDWSQTCPQSVYHCCSRAPEVLLSRPPESKEAQIGCTWTDTEDGCLADKQGVFILERADSRCPVPTWVSWQGSANNGDHDNNEKVPPRSWVHAMFQAFWLSTCIHISSVNPHGDPGRQSCYYNVHFMQNKS